MPNKPNKLSKDKKELPTGQKTTIDEATHEAENRPIDFNPATRARYIRDMIKDIQLWLSQGDSDEQIKPRVGDFIDNYPELYKKLIAREDISPINSMLLMLDKMSEGVISQHQASVVIGKKLVDRFVTPQLNGASEGK